MCFLVLLDTIFLVCVYILQLILRLSMYKLSYAGANAEIIESQITEPLEKAINGIEGVKIISSSSSTVGSSNITVEFNVGADLEKAANDVRDKTSQAARSLPQDIDAPPVVTKADANSDPIITLAVQSTTLTATDLSDYAENVLQEKLQTIPGVSSVGLIWAKTTCNEALAES